MHLHLCNDEPPDNLAIVLKWDAQHYWQLPVSVLRVIPPKVEEVVVPNLVNCISQVV